MMEQVERLKRIAELLYDGREHVAGGKGEVREAERIRGIIEEELGVEAELLSTPVSSWRLKSVSVEPKPAFTAVAPYVESWDVEAPVHHIEGDPSDYRAWRRFPEGRIAVAIPPGNPDDLKYAALHAWEAGAVGLIVGSPVERKIVSTGAWGYSYTSGAPTPIPVVVVDVDSARRIAWEGRARLSVEAETVDSTGYTIRARIGGRGLVAVGSHYDRWYGGFQDNMLGIAQSILAAEALSSRGYGVELLSFTAEEHGAPGYAGWYWAWGSRWYTRQLVEAGLTGEYLVYINYDIAGSRPLVVSGSPQYAGRVHEHLGTLGVPALKRMVECPECDSMSFASAGIPTISIHSLWNEKVRGFYHTPMDTPENADYQAAAAAVEASVRAVAEGPRWRDLEDLLGNLLGEGPLLARNIYYTLVAEAHRRGWSQIYRWMRQRFLKPLLIGDYRYDMGEDLEAYYFPEVYAIRRVREKNPHTVIIPGEERILYQPKPPGGFKEQVHYTLLDLWSRFREELECLEK